MKYLLLVWILVCSVLVQAQEADNYILGPGDIIVIQVFGEVELKLETELTDNGPVNYPFLGHN